MILLVRDEDPPTVAAAVHAVTDEAGLERVDGDVPADNPFAMLDLLACARVAVWSNDESVCVSGLDALDVADPDEWASAISASCESEVVAIAVDDSGLHVWVYDGGELDETIDVPLDPSGMTKADRLVDLAETEHGEHALAAGIRAASVEELFFGVLGALGIGAPPDDAVVLTYRDPLGDGEPGLAVSPSGALEGSVARPVAAGGASFDIQLVGIPPIEGLRLELSGAGLELVGIGTMEIVFRRKDGADLETKTISPEAEGGVVRIDLPEAYLEAAEVTSPAGGASLFETLQQMMSAGESMRRNRMSVSFNAVGLAAGEGSLELSVSPLDPAASNEVPSARATMPVRIV